MSSVVYVVVISLTFGKYEAESKLGGILYPKQSETREVLPLNGLWNFVVSPQFNKLLGHNNKWYKSDLDQLETVSSILMPVPASYNDITQDASIRDHVGVVWYDRKFFVPCTWQQMGRVWIRFSSVHYSTEVWINGELVMAHELGHLPFQQDITHLLNFGEENRVTVACDNTLSATTVPQGDIEELETDKGKRKLQTYTFDFFNYAGIHRPVTLFTTPQSYIDDITVITGIEDDQTTGTVHYNVTYYAEELLNVNVTLYDQSGKIAAKDDGLDLIEGDLRVPKANLWWAYLMNSNPGYLYTLEVKLTSKEGELIDIYRQQIGIRKITWNNKKLMLNGKPIYMHGFGRHEDSDIRGKGLDLALVMKDYNLIKWVGGNAYRTSHYPYSDEVMDLADKMGIMIIDECPSGDTDIFSKELLENHKQSLTELINRDKNRPSVIAWSIANEPRTRKIAARAYFADVANHTRTLDPTRPITLAVAVGVNDDQSGYYLDFISFNRYHGWYTNAGQLDMIIDNIVNEAKAWHQKYNKPVLVSEYGADTMVGLHLQPEFIWSEEYQTALISKHFEAFDILRETGWFIGEFIWNFADFKTKQGYTRVGGNRKGIFTRSRQPKAAAHHLRKRYFHLSNEMFNATLPEDLYYYIAALRQDYAHNEL